MDERTVSVIMATLLRPDPREGRAGATWFESALRGVMAQKIIAGRGWRLEVIVAMDSRAPEPDARLLREVRGIVVPGVEVRWVRAARPWQSAALNIGVKAATGGVLAFLDDDDLWDARWLNTATRLLGDFDLVSSSQTLVDLSGKALSIFDYAVPSSWVIRRGLWDDVGGVDEDLPYHVDTDFLGRVNAARRPRLHLTERGGRSRGSWMLREVGLHSAIAETADPRPLVTRSVNPGGLTGMIQGDPSAAESSREAHRRFVERYGYNPF